MSVEAVITNSESATISCRSVVAEVKTGSLGVLFLCGCLASAALYFIVAYYVNPVRDFAASGNAIWFPAVRRDYRSEKIELLDRWLAAAPGRSVEGLIIGSSRSMLLNSERMQQASGLQCFNFGLASAKGEDFLAALRWVSKKQSQPPKLVVIGLDIESLRDARAAGDSIHPLRELATGTVGPFEYTRMIVPRVATWSYARDVMFSMYLSVRPRPSSVTFSADGTMQYRMHDQRRREGTFSLQAGMDVCMASARKKIEDTISLSAVQVGYLRQTVREAVGAGSKVEVWLTGPHPRTAAFMSSGTHYADLLAQSRGLLGELGVRTFDFHDEAAYGGGPGAWDDCKHFDDTHAGLVGKALLKGLREFVLSSTPTSFCLRFCRSHLPCSGCRATRRSGTCCLRLAGLFSTAGGTGVSAGYCCFRRCSVSVPGC